MAAVAILAAPVLAKNSQATSQTQKTDGESASSSCRAYKQNPDGTWAPLPCQEIGAGSKPQPKSSAQSGDETTR
jgi:hypothetical protein